MAGAMIGGADVTDTASMAAVATTSGQTFGDYADELSGWGRSRTMRNFIIDRLVRRGIPEADAEAAARQMRMSLITAADAVRTAGQELMAVADACAELVATANQVKPKVTTIRTGL